MQENKIIIFLNPLTGWVGQELGKEYRMLLSRTDIEK